MVVHTYIHILPVSEQWRLRAHTEHASQNGDQQIGEEQEHRYHCNGSNGRLHEPDDLPDSFIRGESIAHTRTQEAKQQKIRWVHAYEFRNMMNTRTHIHGRLGDLTEFGRIAFIRTMKSQSMTTAGDGAYIQI